MYSTPLKSCVDKNKASSLLSLLLKPSEKIKFAFCTDLLIENSLYNEHNEHYFDDPFVIEFWQNYNNHKRSLYSTILRHSRLKKDMIQDCINNIQESEPISRSSLLFFSNNFSDNHGYGSEITKHLETNSISKSFYKPNKIKNFRIISDYEHDDCAVVLECLARDCWIKKNYRYFEGIVDRSERLYVITDNNAFKRRFVNHIHINDDYYLCYEKEK